MAILPDLDCPLYDAYRFDKPWNSKENSWVSSCHVDRFYCPADFDAESNWTSYLMLVREQNDPTSKEGHREAKDSIVIIEVKNSGIPWAEPRDITLDELSFQINDPTRPSISSSHPGGAHVLRCMKSGLDIEFLEDTMSPEEVRDLLTGEKSKSDPGE